MIKLLMNRKHLLPEYKSISVMHMERDHFTLEIQALIEHTLKVDSSADIFFIEHDISLRGTGSYTRILSEE